jgi:hypothetical protein
MNMISAKVFFKLFYFLSYKNLSSEISERKKYKLPEEGGRGPLLIETCACG